MLFHNSLFGRESQFFRSCIPMCTLLLTPLTLWCIWTTITYAYYKWIQGVAMILRALQLYPALFMIFQSTFQSCFLLWAYSLPSYRETVRNDNSIQSVLREHIYLNLALALHCFCLSVIASEEVSGLWWFSISEILYRLIAAASLNHLIDTTSKDTVVTFETNQRQEKSERVY